MKKLLLILALGLTLVSCKKEVIEPIVTPVVPTPIEDTITDPVEPIYTPLHDTLYKFVFTYNETVVGSALSFINNDYSTIHQYNVFGKSYSRTLPLKIGDTLRMSSNVMGANTNTFSCTIKLYRKIYSQGDQWVNFWALNPTTIYASGSDPDLYGYWEYIRTN